METDLLRLSVPFGTVMGVLLSLFLVSVLYAIALTVAEQRWGFVSDYTWLTVVIGVGYTLLFLALLSVQAALLALLVFGVSAGPIIARSIWLDVRDRNELRRRLLTAPRRMGNRDDGETLA